MCLIILSNPFWIGGCEWGKTLFVSGTRTNPNMYVAGAQSTGQLLSSMYREGGPWRLHIQPATTIWLVLWSRSSPTAVQWGVGGWFFFLCGSCGYAKKMFRRSRHLTDSIWSSICLGGAKSVETGDRQHCAYVTKSNIDSFLDEPKWNRWYFWYFW